MPSDQQTPVLLAGKYQILKDIGAGGMGVVYLALDVRLNRQVAIKQLQKHINDVTRFKREAKLLAQLNHPHIVQLYDYIDQPSALNDTHELALIMEYVSGKHLGELLATGFYPQRQAVQWLMEIAEGLAAAHKKNIIHRDLKPENILINEQQTIKITDFGIARSVADPRTQESQQLASYSALAPEQVGEGDVSSKTDLFALGILAYQLFCGAHPFGRLDAPAELIRNTCYAKPREPLTLNPELPAALNDIILQLLEKSPEQRPESAASVAALLHGLISQLPATVAGVGTRVLRPELSPQRRTSWRASRQWLIKPHLKSLILAGGAALIVGLLFIAWRWQSDVKVQQRYVGVLPPQLTDSDKLSQQRYAHVLTGLKNALEQTVIQLSAYALIPQRELANLESSIAEIGRASGADVLLQPLVNCIQVRCEVTLARINRKDWIVAEQVSWPILADDYLANFEEAGSYVAKLLGADEALASSGIDEQTYRDYIALELRRERNLEDFDRSIAICQTLIGRAPMFFPLYRKYARLNLNAYDRTRDTRYITSVADLFERAQDIFPRRYEVHVIRIDIDVTTGNYGAASAKLQVLKELHTPLDLQLYLRAKISAGEGRNTEARSALKKAIKLRPRSLYYKWLALSDMRLNDYSAAETSLAKLLQLSPKDEYGLAMRASIAMFEGRLEDAINSYETLVKFHNTPQNLSDLGLSYFIKKDYEKAKWHFASAAAKAPEHATYLLNLADAENILGNADVAKRLYQKVVLTQNTPQILIDEGKISLAQAYAQLGDVENAIATMQALLEGSENSVDILFTASLVYTLVGEKQSALLFYERALNKGMGIVWFQLPWFRDLCQYPSFRNASQNWGKQGICNL